MTSKSLIDQGGVTSLDDANLTLRSGTNFMHRLLTIVRRLLRDESGGLLAAEYLLMGTLLTIGLIVGIASVQDALLSQLQDLAVLIFPP